MIIQAAKKKVLFLAFEIWNNNFSYITPIKELESHYNIEVKQTSWRRNRSKGHVKFEN